MQALVNLVSTTTSDNLQLKGLYAKANSKNPAIIFVHGFQSSIYSHKFVEDSLDVAVNCNHSFLLAENRGTGILTELINNEGDQFIYGSYRELLEEAHLDISAWIELLLSEGHEKIILAGHSLGTFKVIRYLFEGKYKDKIEKLILLAPFDKNAYVEDKTNGEWKKHVEIAKSKINSGQGLDWIPENFDDYPMTYQTYYSWYRLGDLNQIFDFYNKDYDFPILNKIKIPVKIIVGEKDLFFYFQKFNKDVSEIEHILKQNIHKSDITIIKGCGHVFRGYESIVAKEIKDFL